MEVEGLSPWNSLEKFFGGPTRISLRTHRTPGSILKSDGFRILDCFKLLQRASSCRAAVQRGSESEPTSAMLIIASSVHVRVGGGK